MFNEIRTVLTVVILAGMCSCGCSDTTSPQTETAILQTVNSESITLETRYNRISSFIGDEMYGEGGQKVLAVAYDALSEKHRAGEAMMVGLEDVWAHSLQEGLALFNRPDALWGKTTAEETADMIGQTTIGPWQMTISNIRNTYGPPYGVDPLWSEGKIYTYCREHPEIQAKMIIDYIQQSYETFGRRSPYAIQRYFWLQPFVKGEIGQSKDWTKTVVAKPPPGGTWQDLTPEMKADTGFYAKQVLLGTAYTDTGILFWLYISGDQKAIRTTLETWRDQKRIIVTSKNKINNNGLAIEGGYYTQTNEPGGFTIQPQDIVYYQKHPNIQQAIRKIVSEVAQGESK